MSHTCLDCDSLSHYARGLCHKHWQTRNRRSTLPPRIGYKREPSIFLEHTLTRIQDLLLESCEGPCLLWPYALTSDGYAYVHWNGSPRQVSHVVLEAVGQPRSEAEAAHICDNRACIHPAHLCWLSSLLNAWERDHKGAD